MPINNTTVVPIVMAARLFRVYTQRRVFAERTDKTWRGELASGGNTIRISKGAAQSVNDYVVDGNINYANADAEHVVDIGVPKQKSWAVKLDDISAVQSSARLLDEAVYLSGVDLAEQVDADVRAEFEAGATVGPAIALDHDAASLEADDFKIPMLHRLMDVAKLPREGRWLMVGPYTAEMLMRYAVQNTILNAPVVSAMQNGRIGSFGGLDIYVYDPVYAVAGAASQGKFQATESWYYGNDTAVAFVDQIDRTEQLRLQTTFADAVRGLYTYGAKTVDATRIRKSAVTIANVPEGN